MTIIVFSSMLEAMEGSALETVVRLDRRVNSLQKSFSTLLHNLAHFAACHIENSDSAFVDGFSLHVY
jgi:hypothetical protein